MANVLNKGRIIYRTPNRHVNSNVRTAKDRIWHAMRMSPKRFTNQHLCMVTDQTLSTVGKYRKALEQAGYIEEISTTVLNRASVKVYRLVRDTGPLAPLPRYKHAEFYDRNNKEIYQMDIQEGELYFGSAAK